MLLLRQSGRLVTKDHKIEKRNVHSNSFFRIFPAVIARKGQMVNPLVSNLTDIILSPLIVTQFSFFCREVPNQS